MSTGQEELSIANFAASLIEYLMSNWETTDIKYAEGFGVCTLQIGRRMISGVSRDEVFGKFLLESLAINPNIKADELEAAAKSFDERISERDKRLIEDLTEDGMSEHGQLVTENLKQRQALIKEFISSNSAESIEAMVTKINEENPGLNATTAEIMEAAVFD